MTLLCACRTEQRGYTALIIAAVKGSTEVVKLLLLHHAQVDVTSEVSALRIHMGTNCVISIVFRR